jgi:hypothetical protein
VSPFEFSFDDQLVSAEVGHTVAAALLADGRRSWRRTRGGGEPRGVFCGIGVCFDCLVTVNGVPDRRACLTEVHPGDVVTTQIGAGRAELSC